MAVAAKQRVATIALVGNPNTGKSTLFAALSGVHQRVGNYPGVTVEKKLGAMSCDGHRFQLIDLPGTYSLAPRSPDEMVAVDVLLGRQSDADRPDAVLCIVDASNLERNLYLVSQVLELGLPTVVAVNMVDIAEDRGLVLDFELLGRQLGVPVVPVQANRKKGLAELKQALLKHALARETQTAPSTRESPFPSVFQTEVSALAGKLDGSDRLPRYLVERLLLDTSGYLQRTLLANGHSALGSEIVAARERLAAAGLAVPAVEAVARYGWAGRVLTGVVQRPTERRKTWGDRLDAVLTHRLWGTLIFAVLMLLVFQAVFRIADATIVPPGWITEEPLSLKSGIESGFAGLASAVKAVVPPGPLESLLVDGIISGVGSVITFLPQILVLFCFIALLEDCGYMARAAYLMDKLMSRLGLSGKSFIPLLSSFACAIPGVMATRVIENRRDRLVTILIAPLMSCSARLPVYTLLVAAFIPQRKYLGGVFGLQGLTMAAMYAIGMLAATLVAWILKRTLLRGPTPPFVMELPSYKLPSLRIVVMRMLEQGWSFVRRAGTLIVAVSVLVWAALYYPHDTGKVAASLAQQRATLSTKLESLPTKDPRATALQQQLAALDTPEAISGELQRQSFLGRAGRTIEPAVRPLGWDWRIGCAALASFPAREVVVATLGIIYNLGDKLDVENTGDRTRLAAALQDATWEGSDRPVFTIPVALSLMVFFALCAQCAATLVVIGRETRSLRWPVFTFTYMTVLAYLAAMVTYQVGTLIAG